MNAPPCFSSVVVGNPRGLEPWKLLKSVIDRFRSEPTNTTLFSNATRAANVYFKVTKKAKKGQVQTSTVNQKQLQNLRSYILKNSPLTLKR